MNSVRTTCKAAAFALCAAACSKTEPLQPHDAATAHDAATPEALAAEPPEVSEHAHEWPLPNGDYDNTRASAASSIDSASVGQLREAWRLPLAQLAGPFGFVTANPLIVGDAIYVQDMASNVYCVERDSGQSRWVYQANEITVGPNGTALGWGRVFAARGDKAVVALDAHSGSELWRFEPPLVSSEGIDIQPTVYGGSVFVATVPANLRSGYAGGSRGVLFALDARDGHELWHFDTVDSADIWGDSVKNAGGGAWYPPLIDAQRGMSYWGTGNPAPWPGSADAPSGASRPGPNLYTSSLVALDLARGELAWYHQERAHDLFDWDFQNSPLRVRADTTRELPELVIGSGKTGTVVAFAADSGELAWRAKVGRHENDELDSLPADSSISVFPGALGGVLTAVAYADGVVYVPIVDMSADYAGSSVVPNLGNGRGAISALDARDGHVIWNTALPAPTYGSVLVVNDLLLTSDANGRVYALAREDGRELWHYDAPGGINAPLAAAGDMLLVPVGLNAATLIALRLSAP
jgi:glucose dehydrogenase